MRALADSPQVRSARCQRYTSREGKAICGETHKIYSGLTRQPLWLLIEFLRLPFGGKPVSRKAGGFFISRGSQTCGWQGAERESEPH